jgi:hypothetical protein
MNTLDRTLATAHLWIFMGIFRLGRARIVKASLARLTDARSFNQKILSVKSVKNMTIQPD